MMIPKATMVTVDRPASVRILLTLGLLLWTSIAVAQTGNPPNPIIKASQPTRSLDKPGVEEAAAPSESKSQLEEFRVRAIYDRIDLIKEVMARKQALAELENGSSSSMESSTGNKEAPSPMMDVLHLPDRGDGSGVPAVPRVPGESASGPDELNPTPATESDASKAFQGVPVISSPVNSLELANSLFMTQHYAQALKCYEALLNDESGAIDRDWLRCLAANCYRVRHEWAKAERLYRDVSSSRARSYPADHSKWYLDHLTRRKKIQSEIDQLASELQPFEPMETSQ